MLNTNTIIKGTDIGYDKDEIKNTSTEDLITLRKSIIGYITSKKLKKKNQKFIDVYVRVTAELKNRKIKTDLRNNQVKTNRRGPGHEVKKEETEGVFLKRKMSFNSLELEIPSFLHDKTQKKPNNNESSSSLSSSSKFKENPITKICIDGKDIMIYL